jgi:hypothetical protein
LNFSRLLAWLVLALGAWYLVHTTAFIDLDATQKRDTEALGPLDRGHTYVQHFTAGKPFLARMEVGFRTSGRGGGSTITLRLQDGAGEEIAARSSSIPRQVGGFQASLPFKPQRDSTGREYALVIQTDAPPGSLSVMGSEYDAYPGQLLRDGLQIPQDIGFFAYSKPNPFHLLVDVLSGSRARIACLLVISVLFGGLGLAAALALSRSSTLLELAAFSLALGVAIPPLLLLLLSAAGISLTPENLAAVLLAVLAAFLARAAYARRKETARPASFHWQPRESILLLILLTLAVFTRLAQIHDLLVPSGAGGLAHERLLQRIGSRKQNPLDSIYPTGFHLNVTLLHQLSGAELPEATLVFGQWLNAASGLPLYLLARRLLKQPRYALAAAAAWWFLAPIPALLLNWSRYPFVQGLVLLPVAVTFLLPGSRRGAVLPALILTGLLLSHYGLFAIFCVVALGAFLLRGGVERPPILAAVLISLPLLVLMAVRVYAVLTEGTWSRFIGQGVLAYRGGDPGYVFGHTLTHGGPLVWLLGGLGFALLCRRRPSTLLISFGAVAALLLLDAGQLLLFHHSASRPANLLYFLSAPLCILCGFALKVLFQRSRWVTAVFILFAALIGGYNISGGADPVNVFFTAADARAMDWIRANTPVQSTFLVDSYPYDGEYQPEDGGGWIPYLTGREITFLDAAGYEDPARSIEQAGADYIYIGSGYGPLAFPVAGDPDYALIYARDGRFIYSMAP